MITVPLPIVFSNSEMFLFRVQEKKIKYGLFLTFKGTLKMQKNAVYSTSVYIG